MIFLGYAVKINMLSCVKTFREPFNAISHLAGALVSVAGLVFLVVFAAIRGNAWHVVSFAIFGSSLVLLYTSSFLYHTLKISDKALLIFRKIDHIMIFILIAGSYTPICLVPLRGPWGWSIFGVVWGMAFIGIFLKIFAMNVPRWISTMIYLIMGWVCIVAIYPLVKLLDPASLFWLVLGGFFYSSGSVIYAKRKPDPFPETFGFHEIWHLFVLLGSACHFWMAFNLIDIFPS